MHRLFSFFLALLLVTPVIAADSAEPAPPDVMTIMKKAKEVNQPTKASKRKMVVTIKSRGQAVQWIAGQAVKNFPDGRRMVIAMLEPAEIKGTTLLVRERENGSDEIFMYLPALRRVREMKGLAEPNNSFLGTDFTYSDLGFITLDKIYRLLGQEKVGQTQAYKVEAKIPGTEQYYSRIVYWIAADSFLPLQRDFYDLADRLWKTERFESVSIINGVPTPLLIKMQDVQADQSTEISLSMVEYDIEVPDEIFDPAALPMIATHQCWGEYCVVTVPKK